MKARNEQGHLIVGVGARLSWDTIGGDHYEGTIVEMDSNVAYVQLQDGTTIPVEL